MEKPAKTFVSILLFVLAVEICVAQHWSYGLQPGGKRNAENAVGSFPEVGSGRKTTCWLSWAPFPVKDASEEEGTEALLSTCTCLLPPRHADLHIHCH